MRLESIKDGFKMWENRHPLNPPETTDQKMAQEHAKLLAKGFEQHAPEYVEYLLQRLERYETALKRIEATNELVQAHFLANDALKDS